MKLFRFCRHRVWITQLIRAFHRHVYKKVSVPKVSYNCGFDVYIHLDKLDKRSAVLGAVKEQRQLFCCKCGDYFPLCVIGKTNCQCEEHLILYSIFFLVT